MKTNRTVVITGAAGGLGVHFVRRFLNNDDTVIATDLSEEGLRALGNDGRLHKIAADLADEGGISEIVRRIELITGRVDVLINNAGWFPVQPFAEITAQDWQRVLNVNLVAPALLTRAILPLMTGRGWGRLINIGSGSVYGGVPGQVHYVAAKAGIVGMTRSLAREFGHEGITANVVAPGLTMTARARETLPVSIQQAQIELRSLQREEVPQDLVGTVFFLASPDSDFVTGQSIVVDGGNTML